MDFQRIKKRFEALRALRQPWEAYWERIASFVVPDMQRSGFLRSYDAVVESESRSPLIYDSTSLMAIDRLAAGEISFVIPSSTQWHELNLDDPFASAPSDEERIWLDDLADYMFKIRYNPMSGFSLASKAAIKSRSAFGVGVMYISENKGKGSRSPILYQHIPLMENYLATDFNGQVNTNYRLFKKTAAQCVEKWGNQCSAKVQEMAKDEQKKDEYVTLLHAVEPSSDGTNMHYSSVYCEYDNEHIVGKGGYFEFPYAVFHWSRDNQGPYCESAVGLALSEIGSLNELTKQELLATQAWVNPPTAQRADEFNTPDMSPGAPNPGLLSETGELLIKPIITQPNPSFATQVIEAKRNQVREMLYVNLWQILISNPQMTATEAMIRAQEKGDLLGPSGLSLQVGIAHAIDREFSTLEGMQAIKPNRALAAPQSLSGKKIGVAFNGPLDKLRRGGEIVGMQRVMEMAGQIAQLGKPEILERFDFDEMLDIAQDVLGAPRKMFKPRLDDDEQGENDQMKQLMNMMAMAKQGGEAAQAVGQGAQAVQGAGLLPAPVEAA